MSGKKYVCNGAILECNKGTAPAKLLVTKNSKLKVQGKCIATHLDLQVPQTFSLCKLKPKKGGYHPCVPALMPWTKVSPDSTIGGSKKLILESSQCMCSTGGKVTVSDTLQKQTAGSVIIEYLEIAKMMPGAMMGRKTNP